MLKEGDAAPDFEVPTDTGETLRLSGLKGRKVVLYFYPKSYTPGCTVEACQFRDTHPGFEKKGVIVLGVSPDSPKTQAGFRDKHSLPFTLLADRDKTVAKAYGVEKLVGVQRSTFIIGEDGRILKVFPKVKAAGHAEEVLAALDGLQAASTRG